jgi:hypothetical protein
MLSLFIYINGHSWVNLPRKGRGSLNSALPPATPRPILLTPQNLKNNSSRKPAISKNGKELFPQTRKPKTKDAIEKQKKNQKQNSKQTRKVLRIAQKFDILFPNRMQFFG